MLTDFLFAPELCQWPIGRQLFVEKNGLACRVTSLDEF
jgi:hypothetical protein